MGLGPIGDERIFPYLNFVFLGYAILMFLPKWRFSRTITLFIAGVYSFLYLGLVMNWIISNPGKASSVDFSTFDGVLKLFKDNAAVMAGWTHYIAFDLMVARFIVFDAVDNGISHFLVLPLIPLTLMLGPIGLFSYLTLKSIHSLSFGQIMYGVATGLSLFMFVWIMVIPGGFRFGFSSLAASHKVFWHELNLKHFNGEALPPTINTKYIAHPDIVFLHTIPAAAWALLVPLQLLDAARQRLPVLHRMAGYLLLGVLAPLIATGSALILLRGLDISSDYPSDIPGPISELGLSPACWSWLWPWIRGPGERDGQDSWWPYHALIGLLAVRFLAFAVKALLAARRRDFQEHRRSVIRHVASGLSVAVQRLYLAVRYPTTAKEGRGAFYDATFVGVAICIAGSELYLWLDRKKGIDSNKSASTELLKKESKFE